MCSPERRHGSWDLNNGIHVKNPSQGLVQRSPGQMHSTCKGPEAEVSWCVRARKTQFCWGLVRWEESCKRWGEIGWDGENHQHWVGLTKEQTAKILMRHSCYNSAECDPEVTRSQVPELGGMNSWCWGRAFPGVLASEEPRDGRTSLLAINLSPYSLRQIQWVAWPVSAPCCQKLDFVLGSKSPSQVKRGESIPIKSSLQLDARAKGVLRSPVQEKLLCRCENQNHLSHTQPGHRTETAPCCLHSHDWLCYPTAFLRMTVLFQDCLTWIS